jgi:hypothetical protein
MKMLLWSENTLTGTLEAFPPKGKWGELKTGSVDLARNTCCPVAGSWDSPGEHSLSPGYLSFICFEVHVGRQYTQLTLPSVPEHLWKEGAVEEEIYGAK